MKKSRSVIYAKDIARFLEKSPRQGRRIMQEIKKYYGKQKHHLLSVDEFCSYYDVSRDLVIESLH